MTSAEGSVFPSAPSTTGVMSSGICSVSASSMRTVENIATISKTRKTLVKMDFVLGYTTLFV